MADRHAEASLTIEGMAPWRARRATGREALSSHFRYRVELPLEGAPPPASALVGRRAQLRMRDAAGDERLVTGVVGAAEVAITDAEHAALSVDLVPLAHVATLGRDTRILRDVDPVEAARLVLERAGVETIVEVSDRPPVRARIAQYGESDWDLALRLLSDEGVTTWFDHERGSLLVLTDHTPSAPPIAGDPALVRRGGLGLSATAAAIDELGPRVTRAADKVSLRSFDPARPDLALGTSAGAGPIERYDAPGAGLTDPDALARRGDRERARGAASRVGIRARATTCRVAPGRWFSVDGARFLAVEVRIDLVTEDAAAGVDDVRRLEVEVEALPLEVPFFPPPVATAPRHVGLEVARVVGVPGEEIDVDAAGRVRVHAVWDREPIAPADPGRWARVVQRGTEASMLLPRVGWTVMTVSEEGSIDAPTVVSRVFDATHPPPYALPAQKTWTVLRTATSPGGGSFNEIRMEDPKGAEKMVTVASRDMEVDVGHQRIDVTKGRSKVEVGRDQKTDVGQELEVRVQGDASTRVGGDQRETAGLDRNLKVGGDRTTRVGAGRKLKVKQNAERTVGSRALRVGAALLDLTLGAVKAQSRMIHVLVGGAVIKATPRTMSEKVGSEVTASSVISKLPAKAQKIAGLPGVKQALAKIPSLQVGLSVQTIGAAKVETGLVRKIDVTGPYMETVGAGIAYFTGRFSDATTGAAAWTAGSLTIDADEAKLTITSDEKVELVCGDSRLTVLPESVTLAAKAIDMALSADDAVVLDAAEIHHN